MNYLIKTGVFSLVCNYLRPSNKSRKLIINVKCCCFGTNNLLLITKKGIFSIFTVFLKNRNIIFKMKKSKVTDYAALSEAILCQDSASYIIWFKHILLARTVDIIKQMLTILKLQGLEWKQHAYIIPFLITNIIL